MQLCGHLLLELLEHLCWLGSWACCLQFSSWVGAVVGAIPLLLGWAAASGEVSLNAMILPAALYFWQSPHFMALAYLCRDDYIVGGFRMLSLADASGQRTALVSLWSCIYLLPLGFLAYNWGLTSLWFTLESSLLTLCMSIGAVMFVRESTAKNAWRLPNDNQETMLVNSSNLEGLLISYPQEYDYESSSHQKRRIRNANSFHGRAPVAYTSVAPFPFLHAPMYVSPDSWV